MATPLLAPRGANGSDEARPVCTFYLGEALYGLDVRLVQSVNLLPLLTPIPHVPEAVRGYANLRGQINLVLDLKRLLGLGMTELGPDARLVLLKPALGDAFGVLADRVGDIVALRPDQIEARGAEGDEAGPEEGLVRGVGKADRDLILLLDARRLLPRVERAVATGTEC
jgi:purine-binding chemotaxis protein CheW